MRRVSHADRPFRVGLAVMVILFASHALVPSSRYDRSITWRADVGNLLLLPSSSLIDSSFSADLWDPRVWSLWRRVCLCPRKHWIPFRHTHLPSLTVIPTGFPFLASQPVTLCHSPYRPGDELADTDACTGPSPLSPLSIPLHLSLLIEPLSCSGESDFPLSTSSVFHIFPPVYPLT